MSKLQLYTWYKIEDYTMFKNLVYEYLREHYKVCDEDYESSKPFRCVEHICEEQKLNILKY